MTNKTVWNWLTDVLGLKRPIQAGAAFGTNATARGIIIDLQPRRPAPLSPRSAGLRRAPRHWRVEASEMSRRLSSHF